MTQHCRTQTFKMFGPWTISKLFSKPVSCVTLYFSEFYQKEQYFPWLCINSSLIGPLDFYRLYIHFTVSRACQFWPEGRYPQIAYVPTVSSFLSIFSDDSKEYSTPIVRNRKYQRYWDKLAPQSLVLLENSRELIRNFFKFSIFEKGSGTYREH